MTECLASIDAIFSSPDEDEAKEENEHLGRSGPFNKLGTCLIEECCRHGEIESHEYRHRAETEAEHNQHPA